MDHAPQDTCFDYSGWQRRIDFAAAAASGQRLAIGKATGDRDVANNASRKALALSVGMAVADYCFLIPGDGASEAAHFLTFAAPRPRSICVLDWEATGVSRATAEAWVVQVRDAIGAQPILYATAGYLDAAHAGDSPILTACPLWLAQYREIHDGVQYPAYCPAAALTRIPKGWRGDQVVLHQYTSQGVVPGVDGRCDRSVGDVEALIARYPGCAPTAARGVPRG
jgi:GH25 family lysozyme M1 (1,4-beta-N-acetylmuramidase)